MASRFAGGVAGYGSGLARVLTGGRLATSWCILALFIGCIATPCYRPVLQVGRRPLACDNADSRTMLPGVGRDSPLTN